METTRNFYAFSANFPSLVLFVTSFCNALSKAHKLKLRLNFLRKCMSEQVMPKSILPRRILRLAERPFDEFQRIILQKHIEITKVEVEDAFSTLRSRRHGFNQAVPFEWKNRMLDYCYRKLRKCCNRLERKLQIKLKNLIAESDWTKHANVEFIVNLSDKPVDSATTAALGYGLSFGVSDGNMDYVDISKSFCNLEKFCHNLCPEDINICKGIVYGAMAKPSFSNVPLRFLQAYKNLKKDDTLQVTKADKSNAVVIMNKNDYVNKITALLNDNETYTKLRSDPIQTVNSYFSKQVKSILKGSDHLIKKFTSQCSSLPYLYGLVKTHKINNPIRPIISSVGSVSYNLSKWLVKILTPMVGNISNTNVKNNVDFTNKLNSLNLNFDFNMVSFDIVSLFTKVPVDDLLEFLEEELENYDIPLTAGNLTNLIRLCIKDSKFCFNGEFFVQKFGMAMGNPLSPVLSNIYMEFFETKFLPRILPQKVKWFRYVDDIFCIWPIHENLQEFLIKLNNLVPSIKFTIEEERNCKLNFLDVTVHRHDRNFTFSVFRKSTNISSFVHYYSNHHQNVKFSVFSGMFLRALRICSPQFIDDEIKNIYDIAFKLKYPRKFIDVAWKRAKKTFYLTNNKIEFNNHNILKLPYDVRFLEIPRMLKLFNINVVFSNFNVKSLVIKNSPKDVSGCIYEIPCKKCDKIYYGQTGKLLLQRIKQHQYSVRTGQLSNALFVHMKDFDHPINWIKAKSLFPCKDAVKRNIIESCFIKSNNSSVLNLSLGLFKLDAFIIKKIVDKYKQRN